MTTGNGLNISGATYAHTANETGSLVSLVFTDATTTTNTSTTNGLLISPTLNVTTGASGTKTLNGISIAPTFTACTGGSTCNPNGLNIGNVTDGTGITSTGIKVGTGWDTAADFGGNTTTSGVIMSTHATEGLRGSGGAVYLAHNAFTGADPSNSYDFGLYTDVTTRQTRLYSKSGGSDDHISFYTGVGPSEAARFNTTGEFQIASTSDLGDYKLQVTGETKLTTSNNSFPTAVMTNTGAGTAAVLSLTTSGTDSSEIFRAQNSGGAASFVVIPSQPIGATATNNSTPIAYIRNTGTGTASVLRLASDAATGGYLLQGENTTGTAVFTLNNNGSAVFNEPGLSTGDFRIEGDTNANLLFVDASADMVGIGSSGPSDRLYVLASSGQTGITIQKAASGGGDEPTLSLLHSTTGYGARLGVIDNDGSFHIDVQNASTWTNYALMIRSATGNVGIGAGISPSYRLDVLNATTGQTADNRVVNVSNAGSTFNTTAANRTSYGGYFSSTSTESAGSNTLTNTGLYSTASGGDANYAGIFDVSYSAATSITANGLKGSLSLSGNGAYSAPAYSAAMYGKLTISGSADYSYTANHQLAAVLGGVLVDGSGTTADFVTAFRAQPQFYNSAAITTYAGLYLESPEFAASATVTNAYGVYVADQEPAGVTNGWGIYQVGATTQNYFSGEVQIGSTSDLGTYALQVTGNYKLTGTITAGSGSEILTLSTGKIDADALTLATANGNTGTSSFSGMITSSDGLTLLQGCVDGQLLEWTDGGGWACANDDNSGGATALDGLTVATTANDAALDNNANSINWNWDFTSAAVDTGLTISESSASTTGGQDQQALFELTTLASSTASPLQVTAGGADVGDVWFDLTGDSDFEIRNNGTGFGTFTDAGAITFAPTSGQSLTSTLAGAGTFTINSGVTSGTTTSSGVVVNANSLTSGRAMYIGSTSVTNGALIHLDVDTTAATSAGGSQAPLYITTTGANATSGVLTYGAYIANSHSGTLSDNYALFARATGGTNTNVAGSFENQGTGFNPTVRITNSGGGESYTQLAIDGTGQTFSLGVGNSTETNNGVADDFFIFDNDTSAFRLIVRDTTGNIEVPGFAGGGTQCVKTDNAGVLSAGACSGGGTAWDAIGDPSTGGAIAFGSTAQTMDWAAMDANASFFTFNFTNAGTSAGTDSGVVINNAVAGSATDTTTENLLLLQQLDTTTAGTTVVNNALLIDSAGSSAIVDGIEITNSAGNITNGLNLVDTGGGTFTSGIVFSGTFTNAIDAGGTLLSLAELQALDNGIETGDIADSTISEVDLKAVDTANDEECLTYETTTGDFEWQDCAEQPIVIKTKTADETVVSSTTMQTDNHLSFSIAASENWVFRFDLQTSAGNSTPDLKVDILTPASPTSCLWYWDDAEAASSASQVSCGTDTTIPHLNANDPYYIGGSIENGANAGSVALEWAQGTSSASTVYVRRGSSMTAFKVQGADVAEFYSTTDGSLQPGDVVSIDPDNRPIGVKKSSAPYDRGVIGIVSKQPGIALGDERNLDGGKQVPIALSGRVPLKVNTENGPIKVGDYLTTSSTPGVAMRATKSGVIIGQALTHHDAGDPASVGTILVFVKTSFSTGAPTLQALIEEGQTQAPSNGPPDSPPPSVELNKRILEYIVRKKDALSVEGVAISEVSTDRLVAGLEIITPRLLADSVEITGSLVINNPQGGQNVLIDKDGNATFAGTLTAKEIKVDDLAGIQAITDQINSLAEGQQAFTLTASVLSTLSGAITIVQTDIGLLQNAITSLQMAAETTVSGLAALSQADEDILERITSIESILGANVFESLTSVTTQNLKATGDSSFDGKAQFAGLSFFSNTTTFDGGVVFGAPVEFSLPPIFNKDTAGFAVIKEGARKVEVVFEKQYIAQPVTSASVSFEDIIIPATEVTPEAIEALSDAEAQEFLDQGISYIITNKTTKGFTIRINKNAPRDIRFSWTAIAVKDPSVFEGILGGLVITPSPAEETPPDETPTNDGSGDTSAPPTDICPNIDGDQATIPEGYQADIDGNCAVIPTEGTPPSDTPSEEPPTPPVDTTPPAESAPPEEGVTF